MTKKCGWQGEGQRHSLASKGVKSTKKSISRVPDGKTETNKIKWVKWYSIESKDALRQGEIIRLKIDKKDYSDLANPPKDWDGYIYGRVIGGFGTDKTKIGSKIFVDNEAYTFDDCFTKKSKDSFYWRRDPKIEIMIGG